MIDLNPLLLILVLAGSTAPQESLPESFRAHIGLPAESTDSTEIRVWIWGGGQPYSLYRIVKDSDGVSGELILWAEITKPWPDGLSRREARKFTSDVRKLMAKRCTETVSSSDDFMWCRPKLKTNAKWEVLYDDLLPDELLKLPKKLERDCGWTRFDGFTVDIEVLTSGHKNHVSYGNPDFCCAHIACALANHAIDLVGERIR